jgi:predicted nucleic acid-binding protein
LKSRKEELKDLNFKERICLIFIDSSYIIALIVESDQWHDDALRLMDVVSKSEKIITHAMIIETINLIGKCMGGKIGEKIFNYICDNYRIYEKTDLLSRSMIEFLKYDGKISLADSTALITMQDFKIHEIVSFDKDFDGKNGVVRIF